MNLNKHDLENLHGNSSQLEKAPPENIQNFLSTPYHITNEQIRSYEKNGYVKLKQVMTHEALVFYRDLIGMAVGHVFKNDKRLLSEKRVYEQSFLQAHSLGLKYFGLNSFVRAYRFADIVRKVMQVEGVRLYFDQALYKQPGGRITDYHQDSGYWPVEPAAKTATVWFSLVDSSKENGCMAFAKGSHKLSQEAQFVDIFNATGEIEVSGRVRKHEWQWVPLNAGDCTIHSGLTYHRAAANNSNEMREAMTIAFMTHDAIYDWPDNNEKIKDFGKWANEGLKRGDYYTLNSTPRLV